MQPNKAAFRETFNFYAERIASLRNQSPTPQWWEETVQKMSVSLRAANYDHLLLDLLVAVYLELERVVGCEQ